MKFLILNKKSGSHTTSQNSPATQRYWCYCLVSLKWRQVGASPPGVIVRHIQIIFVLKLMLQSRSNETNAKHQPETIHAEDVVF